MNLNVRSCGPLGPVGERWEGTSPWSVACRKMESGPHGVPQEVTVTWSVSMSSTHSSGILSALAFLLLYFFCLFPSLSLFFLQIYFNTQIQKQQIQIHSIYKKSSSIVNKFFKTKFQRKYIFAQVGLYNTHQPSTAMSSNVEAVTWPRQITASWCWWVRIEGKKWKQKY